MASIIRGTTPTIKYTFNSIDISKIVSAYMTIKGETNLEKDLTTATVGETFIAWTLTQQETLAFGDKVSVMLNWKLQDGTRGASAKKTIIIKDNLKVVVI